MPALQKNIKKEEFKQAREFKGRILKLLIRSTNWIVMRASDTRVESGAYDDIIKKRAGEPSEVELEYPKCGARLIGSENFCGMCGTKIWTR